MATISLVFNHQIYQMKWDNLIDIFLETNSHLNLSAIRDKEGVKLKHITDSLEAKEVFSFTDDLEVCDIGTGGGFPLLPLALSYPQVHFVGIDARKKKVDAVNAMIGQLGITNAKAIWTRIEDYQGQFDLITARAVGYIDKLLLWATPLLNKGGHMLIYKQASDEEKADLKQLCKTYKFRILREHYYQLAPEDIQRVLYLIQKT